MTTPADPAAAAAAAVSFILFELAGTTYAVDSRVVQQMEMVARMLNGDFGPDARAVGSPDWLVDAVQPARDRSRAPLFSVM